ncbi:competence negative regulator MecA [Pediococcus damnosus LMG 28219]|uniref:adaptor protein MecA n=1 Tax=Pediococcus damnosus TaxID=51663 RepID=UPI00061F97FD|nr:adaptor protein MecA [Pediococcus damnosus]KJU73982.1 competence negative regulator MecA [Pediococcus damnosus LMG 28219]
MEMERINDDTIRVVIGNDDLSERGITVLDLLGSHKQIEDFFYSILQEVDTDHQFQENDAVTFQVLPNQNGLELFISKNSDMKGNSKVNADNNTFNMNNEDDVSEFIKHQLVQHDDDGKKKKQEPKKDASPADLDPYLNDPDTNTQEFVLKLPNLESMPEIARVLHLESAASNLFKYRDNYYLDLIFFVDESSPETVKNELAVAYEYADASDVTADVLHEHGKEIMSQSALELTRHYFK